MIRDYNKEIQISTFKKIRSFDEMLKTPTEDICYTKINGVGFQIGDVGFIKKKKALLYNYFYYKILDCALCGNKVTRDTFFTCGYIFYRKITKYKYGKKIFNSMQEYAEGMFQEDDRTSSRRIFGEKKRFEK